MTDPRLGQSVPLVPPLYQSSVYNLPDLDALDRVMNGEEPGFIYARDGHPNAQGARRETRGAGVGQMGGRLRIGDGIAVGRISGLRVRRRSHHRQQSRSMDGRRSCCARNCSVSASRRPSSMQTISTRFEPHSRSRRAFCSSRRCRIRCVARLIFPALAEIAREHRAKLIVDNTFATPILYRPLEDGADLVMESLTKVIGGHSDVTLGVLAGNDPELLPAITQIVSTWGLAANPFDCWLCDRGLPTLDLRVRASSANAARLADWLAGTAGVSRVVYPGRPDHPDHAIARRLLGDHFGNMLCFELAAAVKRSIASCDEQRAFRSARRLATSRQR